VGHGDTAHLRTLFEKRPDARELRASTEDILGFSKRRARHDIDARVARVVRLMQDEGSGVSSAEETASAAGLSASHFQHLFTTEVGVPFRRYRGWQRLRAAIRSAAAGASLTDAAHAAGFADQAHFSRAFRAAFGAPPSHGL
jgi:AraC-like DNA-binding protein